MQAVRLHAKQDLRIESIAPPMPPKADEVTLAVTAAGICGSDLHNYRTGAWITRTPSVAGHEFSGIVTATGKGVTHVSAGQRVIVDSRYICGDCPACREGHGQVCDRLGFIGEAIDGGFADAVTLPARNVISAPEGVPDRHLAMAEPLAVALHALRRLAAPEGTEILVTGCGPIGGLVALLARRQCNAVKLVERNAARAACVAEATGAEVIELEDLADLRLFYAVETTGNDAVIDALVHGIAGCGAIALVGIGRAVPLIDPVTLVEREITLHGCHAFTDQDLRDIADMLPDLTAMLDPFIGAQIPLDDVPAAYERHIAGEVAGLKTIICCGGA
ncbi:zinc-binding dehydrogenase [Tropicimonas sp. IMCC6043]|uniref:zinc-dependent alcohol dehydrogenase n=1 Tax=Tropicimonas sp. IMCC6043 TaxID=2510645 RepID=UPI00101BD1BF|nr:alcohol dehydrogenase catalytic domain-containing protein [Tropicimonas sp. IMCC6043]RYH06186.1 dehydrogenase [Tropicimonas sp. IMCC6043]